MKRVLLCAVFTLVSASAWTQIPGLIMSPTALDFQASPDHNATMLDGSPVLTEYKAYYFLNTIPTPTKGQESFVVSLGKPTPDGTGKVTAVNVFGGLVPNTAYKATVVAVGPGGESTFSNVSVPFGRPVLAAPRAVPGTPVPR